MSAFKPPPSSTKRFLAARQIEGLALTFPPLRLVPPLHASEPDPQPNARIKFRESVSTTGCLDAAWWPCTGDMAAELPDLLDGLRTTGRDIRRVAYNVGVWGQLPRRMNIGDHAVRLSGVRAGDGHMICLSDRLGREQIYILVIPPEPLPPIAERALHLAGESGYVSPPDALVTRAAVPEDANPGMHP